MVFQRFNPKQKSSLSPFFFLFFVSFLFFVDLFEGRFILTERDLGPYFIPPRFFWVESIKQGSFPLWNPYQFCGHPFFANPQHAILYPLNLFFFLLPFDVAFNSIIILHFFLGGLFTYLFLRDLKVNPSGALLSGLIFMLSGYLLSVHSLLTILLSSVWTPLMMMFFRRAIHGQGFKNEILTAVFITLSFLGGGIEIVYGNFFILLFMVIFSFRSPSSPPSLTGGEGKKSEEPLLGLLQCGIFIRLRRLLIVSAIFLFLSAIQLIPFLELFIHSIRGQGISYQEATIWSFAPKDFLLFFLPDAYGYFLDMKKYWVSQCWLKTLYTGGLPFILSLLFFLPIRRRSSLPEEEGAGERFEESRRFYLFLIFLSLFFSLGHYNPLYPFVFKYFPLFNGIRYPVKFLYIFILVLSITAGFGFQKLTEWPGREEKKSPKNFFIILSLISGLLLLLTVIGHQEIEHLLKGRGIDIPHFNHLSVNLHHAKRFLFYLAIFFLLLRVGHEVKWKIWIRVLLLLFLVADLFGNMGFYGKEKTFDYFQKTKILEKVSSDMGNFRIFSTGKTISLDTPVLIAGASPLDVFKEKHLPSMNLLFRLYDLWGIDVIRLKRVDDLYKAFTGASSISSTHLIDLYGIKYVISVTPLDEDPRFKLIYARVEGLQGKREDLLKENTIKLYKYLTPSPRAWFVKDFKVFDSKTILSRMIQKEFDPRREVLLEEVPPSLSAPSPKLRSVGNLSLEREGRGGSEVKIISESNNKLFLKVRVKENSLLILSDTHYPGWKVFVDGSPEKIYRANYNFRAIPLKPGEYEVKFIYDPISFKMGALISFLTLIGIVVYFVRRKRRIT